MYEDEYTYLNIKITIVDESYDFYEIFSSIEESQNYMEQCISQGKSKICVFFEPKQFADENITDMDDLENIIFSMTDEMLGQQYARTVGWLEDGIQVKLEKWQ